MTGQQLKNSILQMAVQGKLVPQDPNDEPASVLLERIRSEKEQLIKEGKIKKDKNPSYIFRGADNLPYEKVGKNEPVCIADEVPFEIPDSWEWVRLGNLSEPIDTAFADGPFGSNLKKEHYTDNEEVRIIQLSNIGEDGWRNHNIKYTTYAHAETLSRSCVEPGNIVIAKMMPAGRAIIVPEVNSHYILSSDAVKFVPNRIINKDYLLYAINSDAFRGQVVAEAHGVTRVRTSLTKLKTYFLPIPPINEQMRIVKKLDSLKPYIDQYEDKEKKRKLLDELFPDQLKKSILQEAVQGKLVHQDPNDEPASVLLERIREEKQQLIKGGKIKKDKYESIIFRRDNSHYEKLNGIERCIDDEIPFEIPENWEWVKLNTIAVSSLGKTLDKARNTGNLKPYLCSINVYWDRIDLSKIKEARFENSELDKYKLISNDLLICEGGDVGRCFVWNSNEEMYYQNALHRVRFYDNISPYFFKYIIEYYKGIGIIEAHSKGVTIKHLVQTELNNILFPLPPLAEQHRIVTAYNSLVPYIEQL